MLARVRAPLAGAHRVAVMSVKGGVGKTTVAACLGQALAEHRGDRAVVLDANPDAGTLADRLTGDSRITVRELLNDLEGRHLDRRVPLHEPRRAPAGPGLEQDPRLR